MKVGYYVSSSQQMRKYACDSHNKRKWVGLSVVLDVLSRGGIKAEPCGPCRVAEFDVILVSVTSAMDLWQYARERQSWQVGKYRVILGGYGILNIRPFLHLADAFAFGRSESFVVDLVRAVAAGERFDHESVAFSSSFSPDNTYRICQTDSQYPYAVRLSDGSTWSESVVGCQGRCLFCGYTWHRKHNGILHQESTRGKSSIWSSSTVEKTMLSLDMDRPETWEIDGSLRIIGLDGFSERIRRRVNKPITKIALKRFFTGLSSISPAHYIKVYNVIGYPWEDQSDWNEFKDAILDADSDMPPGDRWNIVLHCTPFKAFPCTPLSCEPMSLENFRSRIPRDLMIGGPYRGSVFFEGKRLWAKADWGIDGPATQALWAIAFRGTEVDQAAVTLLAKSDRFWKSDGSTKLATLRKYFDISGLTGPQEKSKIATRYLRSWWQS